MSFSSKFVFSISKALSALALAVGVSGSVIADQGYYRTPAIHGETIVFASEGDLWRASIAGGIAYRLTTHEEEETSPKISTDGKWLAFTANYDGAVEAYVMPLAGGSPKQISFDGGRVWVRGWTAAGDVLYASQNVSGATPRVLRTVNPDTLDETELPLDGAINGSFAGDGKTLFFSRYGMEMNRDNAKLYRGGGMAQLWKFDTSREREATRLAADFGAPIRSPLWYDGRIYFISDKSGSGNIWSMNERGRDIKQVTNHSGWDVRGLYIQGGKIAYRMGADIYIHDIESNVSNAITLDLVTDDDDSRVRWINKPLDFLTSARFGGGKSRLALTARGKIAVASTGPLRLVDFDVPGTARARNAVVGVLGKWVYAILDQGDFGEIWRYPLSGGAGAEMLTSNADARRWQFYLAPDGKSLIHSDEKERLWLLDLETKENTLIEQATDGLGDNVFGGITFSTDGKLIAYHRGDHRGAVGIYLYDKENAKLEKVTADKYDSYNPAFSSGGDWLYFISDRSFTASPTGPWGDRNMGPRFDKRGKLYALALHPDKRFPFQPADELIAEDNSSETEGEKDKSDDDAEQPAEMADAVVWDDLKGRLYEIPVPAGNYSGLEANESFLYILDRNGPGPAALKSLKITSDKPKLESFSGGVSSFELSPDKKTLFFTKGRNGRSGNFYIVKAGAKAPGALADAKVQTRSWKIAVSPTEEWPQLFADAWRMHRDFSFDPNMRGLDWSAIKAKYEPLVSRVGHRAELNDLIGQMTSELGILHSQIGAGDIPQDDETGADASLGAVFEKADDNLRIKHIYRSEEGQPSDRSPLAKPGIDAQVGDLLLEINGRQVAHHSDLQMALRERVGEQVLMKLKRGSAEPHSIIAKPVSMREHTLLRYRDWVETNAAKVRAADGDNIGYLHIRAMGGNDIAAFTRDFFEHWDKDGIVIDVRGNRGGNIDSWLIQTFLRKVWSFWNFNGRTLPYGNMQQTFRGHVVVLVNQSTYSDGETFAAGMKSLGLAPLIGTRTAGAGIWLSDRNRLADGGIARIAESAQFGMDGSWLFEGHGVTPTIDVENPPLATYRGSDLQLETALKYLQNKIKSEPIPKLEGQALPSVGNYGKDIDE